jgi:hypothetical protein
MKKLINAATSFVRDSMNILHLFFVHIAGGALLPPVGGKVRLFLFNEYLFWWLFGWICFSGARAAMYFSPPVPFLPATKLSPLVTAAFAGLSIILSVRFLRNQQEPFLDLHFLINMSVNFLINSFLLLAGVDVAFGFAISLLGCSN